MMSTVALWSLALLAIACTTPATPGEGPSEDGVPEADSDEVDSGVGDTGADTADTADTAVPDTADTRDSADTADTTDTGPPPFWALPDEDLTDEVCSRVHEEIAIRDWYDYSWQNGILEDVTDSTGQLRWHVRYDENYDYPDARRFTSVYDAAGLRTQELETIDGDTEVTAARAYEYTPEGWLSVEWADDYNADGVFNRAWTWTYDADGRVVSAVSRNEPETSRYVTTTTWTPEGRTEVDESSAAGVVDWRETRTYTVDNLPLTDELDRDADGVPEYVYIWTRDEDGRLLSMSEATPYHAEAVYSVYTYDDEGLLVSEAGGWDGDEYQTDYQYGAAGELLDARTTYADGSNDLHLVYTYDAELRLLTLEETTENRAGKITWSSLETRTYDAAGVLLTDEWDEDEDGTVDWWDYVTFDTVPC